jgi:hypothetical protein
MLAPVGYQVTAWVGGIHIWGPGIRPNPSEFDPLPNPSETGIHLDRVEMPIQTATYAIPHPCGATRIPPESARIRPSIEPVRIRKPQPRVTPPHLYIVDEAGEYDHSY